MKHDEGAERKPRRERGRPIWHDGKEAIAPPRLMVLGAILAMALLAVALLPPPRVILVRGTITPKPVTRRQAVHDG
jgi:hypothetical protein